MVFDIRTLILLNFAINVVNAAMMAMLWRENRRRFAGLSLWLANMVLHVAGTGLILLRGLLPDLALILLVLANGAMLTGALLLLLGFERFVDKIRRQFHNYLLLALFFVLFGYFTVLQPNLTVREIVLAAMIVVFFSQSAWLLLRRVDPALRPVTRITGFAMVGYVLLAGLQFVSLGIAPFQTSNFFTSGLLSELAVTGYIMLSIALTISLLIMVNRRLLMQVQGEEEKFDRAFHTAPYAILITRLSDGKIIEANQGFLDLSGYTKTEVIGKTIPDLNLYADPSDRTVVVAELSACNRLNSQDFQFRRKSGATFTGILSSERMLLDGQICAVSSIVDITERKCAEKALKASEENYRNLVETSDSAIAALNRDGQILYANPVSVRIWDDPELVGKTLHDLFPWEAANRFLTVVHKVIDEQIVDLNELQLNIRGAAMWFRVSMTPIKNSDGSVKILLLNAMDTTERQRTAAALAAAKESAEAANRAKSQFLANMSHELRTPLSAILGFSELIVEDENLTPEQKEYLSIINRSGDHLLSLINDVLDMAKIEAGRTMLQIQDVDLLQLLNDIKELFRVSTASKGLALQLIYDPNLPRIIRTDAVKLRQMLINLLSNAIKFTEAGSVQVSVTPVGAVEPGAESRLRFVVQDTGAGIAKDDLAAIFEPFVQVGRANATSEGTGLGLPISRQFARLLGGNLTVSSAGIPGQGSQFVLEIVVGVVASDVAADVAVPARLQRLAPGVPAPRLLVAEDRPESRKLLSGLLTRLGFDVRAVENGQQALSIWAEWQPHLIWMDINMPVMDGKEATQRIKATPQGQQTVVVAISASVLDEQQMEVLAAGCDDFVRKPYHEEEIIHCLLRHLDVELRYNREPANGDAPVDAQTPVPFDPHTFSVELAPAGWLEQVTAAAVAADMSRLQALATQVQDDQPALSNTMFTCLDNFDYPAILAVVKIITAQGIAETTEEP